MPHSPAPPYTDEAAERSVLGGIMLNGEAWYEVFDIVAGSDFCRPRHQVIFEAMKTLSSGLQSLDAVTVSDAIKARGLLDKIGGIAYLADLVDATPSGANVAAYARIVREWSVLREPAGSDGSPGEIDTGLRDLDDMTGGLQIGDLVVIAGRPAMGKTALALNIVEHVVMQSRAPTLVFSLEMPADQLTMRMLSLLAGVDQSRVCRGSLEEGDWPRLIGAFTTLQDAPLCIDATPALAAADLLERARQCAGKHGGLGLIVVDCLQLLRGSSQTTNRKEEISEISRSLKALAVDMDCVVIAVSQLNRALESRADKRPVIADLRLGGAIEWHADLVVFVYRDEVYDEDTKDKDIAELIVGKQRNGLAGTVKVRFVDALTRFEDLAPDRYDTAAARRAE